MNQNNSPKLYCGSGKLVGQYGQISVSLCLDDLIKDYVTTGKNGKRYINLKVSPKKTPDQYGKTHSVEIDTWKPQQAQNFQQQPNPTDDLWASNDSGVPF